MFTGGATITAAPLPTWRIGMSVNQYKSLTGTEPNTVACPNYSGSNGGNRIDTWSPIAYDATRHKLKSLATGGHANYYGNEGTECDVSANEPAAWTTIYAGSSFALLNTAFFNSGARYSDGKVASVHGYYSYVHIPQRDRIFRFGAQVIATNADSKASVDAYDLANNDWDPASSFTDVPGSPGSSGTGWACPKDSSGNVYVLTSNAAPLQKWTQATDTWSNLPGIQPFSGFETAAALDTDLNHILYVRETEISLYDLDALTWSSPTLVGAGAAALQALLKGIGLVYVAGISAYIARGGASGSTFYKITDPDNGTLSVTVITATGDTPPATEVIGGTENVYGKVVVDETYGGIFYVPKFNQPVGFLRTH